MGGVIRTPVNPVVLYQLQAYHIGNGDCPFAPHNIFPSTCLCFQWKLFQWKTVKLYGNDGLQRLTGPGHKISVVTDFQLAIGWMYTTIGKKQASKCVCVHMFETLEWFLQRPVASVPPYVCYINT